MAGCDRSPFTLLLLVAIWWFANAVTSIASKSEVGVSRLGDNTASAALRWVELTTVQFLLGSCVSAAWLLFVSRGILPLNAPEYKKEHWIAILGNLLGHLSVNISYTFVSSSATQVIKSSEPIFMFFLLMCFGYDGQRKQLNTSVLMSLVLMSLGTCLFVMWDVTFNIWGVLAAFVSNTAFPIRNIALKKLGDHSDNSPLKRYFVLSFYGSLILIPLLCVKLMVQHSLLLSNWGTVAASFHCIYNIASIAVLREISPMNHAILNFIKRVFVISANIRYFNTLMTWQMTLGLGIVCVGLALYYFLQKSALQFTIKHVRIGKKTCSLVGLLGLFFYALVFLINNNTPAKESGLDKSNDITTSWVYERPLPREVVENIKSVSNQNPGMFLHVYCGSIQCTQSTQGIGNPRITASFLVIPQLLKGTPFEAWIMRHPLHKILSGEHFEDYLQKAVQISHLWHYGGIFFVPTVRIKSGQFSSQNEWITISSRDPSGAVPSILDVSSFPPRHPYISVLADTLAKEYLKFSNEDVPVDFRGIVWKTYRSYCNGNNATWRCPVNSGHLIEIIPTPESGQRQRRTHFGTLSYNSIVGIHGIANLGDEIQGFPGVQFLPYVDFFLERAAQAVPNPKEKYTLFYNAWWALGSHWPPSSNIDPVMLSIHINGYFKRNASRPESVKFLKSKAPIGCRDHPTQQFLQRFGIETFFSGCLTLFLRNQNGEKNRTNRIYLVDIAKTFRDLIPEEIRKQCIVVTHGKRYSKDQYSNTKGRVIEAYKRVEMYSRAKLVVTQRIHSALPSVGMGTPVIFINSGKLPGGSESLSKGSDRVRGLTELFHTLNMLNKSTEHARKWLEKFNWNNPPKNPNVDTRMRLVASTWNVIRKRRVFHESARKFGLLPLISRSLIGNSQLVFHLIFPSSGQDVQSKFSFRHWRCVESILRHHHASKVIVHSNSLQQSQFGVLTEVGYDLEVKRYSLVALVQDAHGLDINVDSLGKRGMKYQTDLLRFLVLYKYGGVFIDINAIVVRSLDTIEGNVFETDPKDANDGAVMKFEKGNPFLKATLEIFAKFYKEDSQGTFSFSQVWKPWSSKAEKSGLKIVSGKLAFVFQGEKAVKECVYDIAGGTFERQSKSIQDSWYVVHLAFNLPNAIENSEEKLKDGTICKDLLNSHCVLCNKVY